MIERTIAIACARVVAGAALALTKMELATNRSNAIAKVVFEGEWFIIGFLFS